jgi:hypothetical protein
MPKHRTTSATVRAGGAVVAALAITVTLLTTTPAVAQAAGPRDQVARFLADHPEARKISSNQVSWHGGDVVMTFPGLPRLTSTCSSGWSCVYEHSDFGGRRLQFRSCGYTQSLGLYGFANATSSWMNRRSDVTVVRDSGSLLWTSPGYSSSRYVGNAANDRADTIYLAC